MIKKILLSVFIALYGSVFLYAQNSYADSLVTALERLQQPDASADYQQGMFPSQRLYLSGRIREKEDDNIFFTALIVWTLKSIHSGLSLKNQAIVDAICRRAEPNYYRYRNKDGKPVYNFWQTNPSRHFPNSSYFSRRKKYKIPDDLDDTSIIYLSADFSDSLKKAVKQLMAENANGRKRTIRNTYKKYKKVPAYSTWFGENMPVDFDICVHANALRFVLDNRLKLNRYDSATVQLIKDMVTSGIYLKRPAYVSPHYQNPAIILYHLARLVAAHPEQPELAVLKPQLIRDLYVHLKTVTRGMEKILLQTSLLRLGEQVAQRINVSDKETDTFYFFVANMTSVFPNPVKGVFAKSRNTNFYYRCRAYCTALLLENEILRLKNAVSTLH